MNPILELTGMLEAAEWIIGAARGAMHPERGSHTAPTREEMMEAMTEWLDDYDKMHGDKPRSKRVGQAKKS